MQTMINSAHWRSVATAAALLLAGCSRNSGELVVSGRVEVDDVRIGSKVGGRVARVAAEEGRTVKAGDAIVFLDDAELQAQLAQARASQAQAQAQLDLLQAGSRKEDIARAEGVVNARKSELEMRRKGFRDEEVREAEAQVASARSALDLAKKELERSETLRKLGTVELRDLDRKRADHDNAVALLQVALQREALVRSGSRPEEIGVAEAQLKQAQADLDRLRNGARPEEVAAARAAVEAARANVARLQAQLDEMRISAPADALVDTLDLRPGDLVRAGETVAILYLRTRPWVRCYVPENRLGDMKPGADVTVTVDTWPGRQFKGQVRRLAAEAEFTPRNVQTTEKRAELVFEMKVDVTDGAEDLRAGMFADVRVPAGKKP